MSGIWTMQVPVLSTAHLPHHEAVQDAYDYATYEGGWFVRLPDDVEVNDPLDQPWPQWIKDTRNWLNAQGLQDQRWVRFDMDGDIAEGLKTYAW